MQEFKVDTSNVDPEISSLPGPQLVVPVDNARYALNAANARWGSLLDAFYGTDAGPAETPGLEKGKTYNPNRGAKVFEYAHSFLDEFFALADRAKYNDVKAFAVATETNGQAKLAAVLKNGNTAGLKDATQFVGYTLDKNKSVSSVLLKQNGLHAEIAIDRDSQVGATHAAGVKDVIIESAVTAIADCEDSVAAVDAEDKAIVYKNWSGLMKGDLSNTFKKGGKVMTRVLNTDKVFMSAKDSGATDYVVPGRACLLIRNVGLHMHTDAVLTRDGREVPEGLLDLMVTTLAALHDLRKPSGQRNSRTGSMYIVKPKQHGPEEVQFTCDTFAFAEKAFRLAPNTLKIGIMDEERRTTVNLKECIRIAKNRCIFINTGFLDRTGDEIHTSFRAGPVLPKKSIAAATWRVAYEDWNVDVGIATGLLGRAQIGKGMWAAPDNMAEMLKKKGGHPKSGATTAWVPSPTAATLHAIHYHETNVHEVQKKLAAGGKRAKLEDILIPPLLADPKSLSADAIQKQLEDNAQGILGYVVRWIELGVGCSKVPDIDNVGLMEDRATLRISSQHIANWLHHGLVTKDQVVATFKKMAQVVDRQNENQAGYRPMSPDFNNNGFNAALELVFRGLECKNGLTEYTLTRFRRMEKAQLRAAKL